MHVFAVAGEASGDALGAAFMAGLRDLAPGAQVSGVGGAAMQAAGLHSLYPMEDLSVMGLAEIVPRYPLLRRRLHQTVAAVLADPPDVLLTIDSPDFGLRVARLVRARAPHIHTVHYVAPSVWAWRPGRAAKMAGTIDQVLALLPFEPPYMEAAGMRCDFVGHPVVARPEPSAEAVSALRSEALGGAVGPLILVLPGSRRSEVTRLSPIFGAAVAEMRRAHPGLRVVLPAAPSVAPLVRAAVAEWEVSTLVIDPAEADAGARKAAAFAAADVALAASGTVSLELAAAGTPMVIGYDMAWLTMRIMRRMALIDTVTLVNLVSETRVVPECIGPECRPELLSAALSDTLARPQAQKAAMATTMARLGASGAPPGHRAAQAVLDGVRG